MAVKKIMRLLAAGLLASTLAGCGGNMSVGYAPVASCASPDLDPATCSR